MAKDVNQTASLLKEHFVLSNLSRLPKQNPSTCASHILKGSALGDGIDWIIRNAPLTETQFDLRLLPSRAVNSRRVQNVPQFSLSGESLARIFFIYCLGSGLSVSNCTISTTENHHSSLNQVLLICFPSKTTKAFSD